MAQSLNDIWGVGKPAPSSAPKKKKSEPLQPKPTTATVENIWSAPPGKKSKPEKKDYRLSTDWILKINPWYEERPIDELSAGTQTFLAVTNNFLQGFAFGADIVRDEEKLTKVNKNIATGSAIAGDIARMGLEVLISGGIVSIATKGIRAVSWGSKALTISTKAAAAAGKWAPALVKTAGNAAARGAVFSSIEQTFAPEGRKPGLKGTVLNTAMFGGGGVGNQLTRNVLTQVAPNMKPILANLVATIGDEVGELAAGLPLVDNREAFINDFGTQVLVVGVLDTLMFASAHNHFLKNSPELQKQLQRARKAADEYHKTGSAVSQTKFFEAADKVIELGVTKNPKDAQGVAWVTKLLDEVGEDRIKAARGAALNKKSPVQPVAVDPQKSIVDRTAQWLLKQPNKVSAAELDKLRRVYKPANGDSINTTRFSASGETLRVIKQVADSIERPVKESLKEVELKAKQNLEVDKAALQRTVEEFGLPLREAQKLFEATRNAPELMTRYRAVVASNAAEIRAVAKKIHSSPATATDLEIAQLLYRIELQTQMTTTLKGLWNNFGRTLSSGRIIVSDKWVDFGDLTPAMMKESLDAADKVTAVIKQAGGREEALKRIKDITNAPGLGAINKASKKIAKDKMIMRALVEARTASLLTSPFTTAYNVVSQGLNQVFEHTVEAAATGVGGLRRLAAGDYQGRMSARELAARIKGDLDGINHMMMNPIIRAKDVNGVPHTVEALGVMNLLTKLFEAPEMLENWIDTTSLNSRAKVEGVDGKTARVLLADLLGADKLDMEKTSIRDLLYKLGDKLFTAQRVASFGTLELTDRPFAYAGYFSELDGRLQNMVGTRKLTKIQADRLKEQVLTRRKQKLLAKQKVELPEEPLLRNLSKEHLALIDELDEAAMKHSNEMTWKDPLRAELAQDFERFLNKHPALRLLVPFYHTPMKILSKATIDSSPLGLFSKNVMADMRGFNGERARDMAVARMLVGTALYTTGVSLALSGNITPKAITPGQKRQMQDANIPEYAVWVPHVNKWVEISRLDPAPGQFFTLMADLVNVMNNPELQEEDAFTIVSKAVMTMVSNVLEKNWMKSVNDSLNALFGRGTENWVERNVDTAIPGYGLRKALPQMKLGGLNPTYQDHFQETESFLERFFPQRDSLDTFGKPIPNQTRFMGIKYTAPTDSPIRRELIKLGLTLSKPTGMMYGAKLTPDQHHAILKALDEVFHVEDRLNELVTSESWRHETRIEVKKYLLERYYNAFKSAAQKYVMTQDPELKQSIIQAMQDKRAEFLDTSARNNIFAPWAAKGEQ